MSQETNAETKGRLAALQALAESPGWELVTKEVRRRLEKAIAEACDLDRPGRKRAGAAGAANEMEAFLKYVPSMISSLEAKLIEQRKRAGIQKPPS